MSERRSREALQGRTWWREAYRSVKKAVLAQRPTRQRWGWRLRRDTVKWLCGGAEMWQSGGGPSTRLQSLEGSGPQLEQHGNVSSILQEKEDDIAKQQEERLSQSPLV
ncbi:hypothetical protein NDU88_006371 [Pleurodeles waltl]|uniref:Uncharacterized protein n=1 Tax=Pleurodeles waltl TaxID=8319 RepID=A0AAV7PQG2_PLEWA|nr:hypothetical protein NDU88_006371 [Pleurodeles waltl]